MKRHYFFQVLIAFLTITVVSCNLIRKEIPDIALIPVSTGDEYQYIDKDGKIVINPQFSEATIFREGLALVRTSSDDPKWGFIGEDGKYVIPALYKEATIFSEGLAWVVTKNGAPTAINKKGEIVITLQNAEDVKIFKDGLAAFRVTDSAGYKWGFVDKTGAIKINAQFAYAGSFAEDLCAVRNTDGKVGYINKEGVIVINNQFDRAQDFKDGFAIVYIGGKTGVIDKKGKYVINPQYSDMSMDGDKFLINQDGKWGWCDNEGKILINPQFASAYPFGESKLAAVQSGENFGYIDEDGKIIINPQFERAFPLNGGLAMVSSSGKIGFIDDEGKYVINPQFDRVSIDLVRYMYSGESMYTEVVTDYFNIAAVISEIDINLPEGLAMSSTFSDVISKFGVTESAFNEYANEHMILDDKNITTGANFDFFVLGRPYIQVQDGWSSRNVFDPNQSVNGYAYRINLNEKGALRSGEIKTQVESTLTEFQKDTTSEENNSLYTNGKVNVRIMDMGREVIVLITKNKQV